MRIIGSLFGLLVLLFASPGCSYFAGLLNRDGAAGAVIGFSEGETNLIRSGESTRPGPGHSLQPSDIIETGPDSRLDVVVDGFGILKMGPDTRIHFERLGQRGVRIVQNRGDLVSMIERMDRGSSYSIVMPSVRAEVRGTTFMTSVRPGRRESTVRVSVLTGAVSVGTETESVFLDRGMQIVIAEGGERISPEMVHPLTGDALGTMQRLAAVHRSSIEKYVSAFEEIRSSTPEIRMLESAPSETVIHSEGNRTDTTIEVTEEGAPDPSGTGSDSNGIKVEEGFFPQPDDAFR